MAKKIEQMIALVLFRFLYLGGAMLSVLWIFFYVYDKSHGFR